MRVFVQNLYPGTEYMGQVSDYVIIAQLNNGMTIGIFDYHCFARAINRYTVIECLLVGFLPHNVNSVDFSKGYDKFRPIFTGEFIGDYMIPDDWTQFFKKREPTQTYKSITRDPNGNVIHEYEFESPKRLKEQKTKAPRIYHAVQTVNGILPLFFDSPAENLKEGEIISFSVPRVDLEAWRPLNSE